MRYYDVQQEFKYQMYYAFKELYDKDVQRLVEIKETYVKLFKKSGKIMKLRQLLWII